MYKAAEMCLARYVAASGDSSGVVLFLSLCYFCRSELLFWNRTGVFRKSAPQMSAPGALIRVDFPNERPEALIRI